MFFHDKRLQYVAKPDKPDPVYARKLQEVLGGQWGEITVSMQYLFQGWSCRGPMKYRDMLDIGTEEIAHVEMLATMIARLLEGAPVAVQEEAVRDPAVMAVMGGMNPQHIIVSGLGPQVADSVGVPWNGRYVTASGNLLADFRYNLTAESMGRLQVCRLYEQTTDPGVRDGCRSSSRATRCTRISGSPRSRSSRPTGSMRHRCLTRSHSRSSFGTCPISSGTVRQASRVRRASGRGARRRTVAARSNMSRILDRSDRSRTLGPLTRERGGRRRPR